MVAVVFTNADRVLLAFGDHDVWGKTRVQKYGFLLGKLQQTEMDGMRDRYGVSWYDDWMAMWYGPYSHGMHLDLERGRKNGLIGKIGMPMKRDGKSDVYKLTRRGRFRWRRLCYEVPEVRVLDKAMESYQRVPYMQLLNQIWSGWPEYANRGRIRRNAAAIAEMRAAGPARTSP